MKCPRCRGYGRAIVLVKQKEGFYGTEQTVCPECNGKGIIEQTNEEWFCQLPTEEKAEFLSNSGMFESRNEALFWLKEIHE